MYQRKARSLVQPIYLIESVYPSNLYEREYVVMGSTGNVYHVKIDTGCECTCPDFAQRGTRCKHIYFVLIKIMKVIEQNQDKMNFSKEDLLCMFNNIPKITNNFMVNNDLRHLYEQKKGTGVVVQRDTKDICAICLDDLENGLELDYCKYSCGNSVHKECHKMWASHHSNQCVFCKSDWNIGSQYINLQ